MMHPVSVAERAKAYIGMVLLHTTNQPSVQRCESNCFQKWTPPPDGWLMVNVGAAIFKDPPRAGAGVVIRDHVWDFKLAFCKMIHTVDDPELAEALAVQCGVLFAQEHNLQQVIVASDCQNIIKKINSPLQDRSHVGAIVRDVKNLVYGAPVLLLLIVEVAMRQLM